MVSLVKTAIKKGFKAFLVVTSGSEFTTDIKAFI